jgi:hypothetical protein
MTTLTYDDFRREFASIASIYSDIDVIELALEDIVPLVDLFNNDTYRVRLVIVLLMRKLHFSIDVSIQGINSGLNLYNLYQEYKKVTSKRKECYPTPSIDEKNKREITDDDILNLRIELNTNTFFERVEVWKDHV